MFPLPLVWDIGRSRQLRIILLISHILGILAIFQAALPFLWQWIGAGTLVLSLAYYDRTTEDIRLRGNQNGELEIWHDLRWQVAHLAGSSVVLPSCTLMRISMGSTLRRRNIVVLRDSLPEEDFRRLRVWLRWRACKHDEPESEDQYR